MKQIRPSQNWTCKARASWACEAPTPLDKPMRQNKVGLSHFPTWDKLLHFKNTLTQYTVFQYCFPTSSSSSLPHDQNMANAVVLPVIEKVTALQQWSSPHPFCFLYYILLLFMLIFLYSSPSKCKLFCTELIASGLNGATIFHTSWENLHGKMINFSSN